MKAPYFSKKKYGQWQCNCICSIIIKSMQTNLSMLCQNVNPRREVQQEYVGHAVAISYSIGYS